MTAPLPPGPRAAPFGLPFIRRFQTDPLAFITEVGQTYGDLAYFRMGPVKACFVNSPELFREILVTRAKLFRKQQMALDALRQVDGEGLVVTEGDFWLRQRRLLQPAFHPRRLEGYSRAIVDRTRQVLDRWPPDQTVNIVDEMTRLTVEIIAKVFYDVDVTRQAEELGQAVRTLSEIFYAQLSRGPLQWPTWMPTAENRKKKRAIATLRGQIDAMIRERRGGLVDRGDLLSMLLLAVDDEGDGKGMTDRQARDEAVTMFNAGHDSTAAMLAWLWYLIAKHPEVEQRMIAEVDSVLGTHSATGADLPRLTYLHQVVRETLRLYPAVWTLFIRVPVQEIELGGYRIPQGTFLYMFPWVTQRDPRFWKDPLQFDPERFAPDRESQIIPYSWIPFGAGPHVCIGQLLATSEMVLIAATLLQRCRLAFAAGQSAEVEPEPLLAIRPKGGLRMTVTERERPGARLPD